MAVFVDLFLIFGSVVAAEFHVAMYEVEQEWSWRNCEPFGYAIPPSLVGLAERHAVDTYHIGVVDPFGAALRVSEFITAVELVFDIAPAYFRIFGENRVGYLGFVVDPDGETCSLVAETVYMLDC